jgi:hypothetical protein
MLVKLNPRDVSGACETHVLLGLRSWIAQAGAALQPIPLEDNQMTRIPTFTLAIFLLSLPTGAQTTATAKLPALNLPGDTALLAQLNTNLDLEQSKPGDDVQAETTHDVKQGKEVLLKKGSTLMGHISFVEPASVQQPQNMVGIVFDRAKPKNGSDQTLNLVVRALAPQSEVPGNTQIAGGRGMPGETTQAGISGRDQAERGGIEPLSTSSVGVSNLPGLALSLRKSATGQQTTVLASAKGDIKPKKGSQLVMLVVGQ